MNSNEYKVSSLNIEINNSHNFKNKAIIAQFSRSNGLNSLKYFQT